MQPPIPAAARDTSNLDVEDSRLLAGPTAQSEPLIGRVSSLDLPFAHRRSERSGRHASLEDALRVITPLVTATAEWVSTDGYVERRTAVPSAGARHPLTALLLSRSDSAKRHEAWAVSPSAAPRRYEVTGHQPQIRNVLRATGDALQIPPAPSTVIVMLARFRRTLSKYPDGQSLVWRDSGVFLGNAHLIAASLELHSCIVGIAETASFDLNGTSETLLDVGALALWRKE